MAEDSAPLTNESDLTNETLALLKEHKIDAKTLDALRAKHSDTTLYLHKRAAVIWREATNIEVRRFGDESEKKRMQASDTFARNLIVYPTGDAVSKVKQGVILNITVDAMAVAEENKTADSVKLGAA